MLLGNEGLADMLDVTVGVKLVSGELETELLLEKLKVGSMSVGWVDVVDPAEVRRKAANFCRLEARRKGEFFTSFDTSFSELLSIFLTKDEKTEMLAIK